VFVNRPPLFVHAAERATDAEHLQSIKMCREAALFLCNAARRAGAAILLYRVAARVYAMAACC
jgi:hypothetical protein